ncbi:hypothetical protein Yalta_064 [Yalta virus]|nr:hypothetical protein Yalta_064 [Yalta virus]
MSIIKDLEQQVLNFNIKDNMNTNMNTNMNYSSNTNQSTNQSTILRHSLNSNHSSNSNHSPLINNMNNHLSFSHTLPLYTTGKIKKVQSNEENKIKSRNQRSIKKNNDIRSFRMFKNNNNSLPPYKKEWKSIIDSIRKPYYDDLGQKQDSNNNIKDYLSGFTGCDLNTHKDYYLPFNQIFYPSCKQCLDNLNVLSNIKLNTKSNMIIDHKLNKNMDNDNNSNMVNKVSSSSDVEYVPINCYQYTPSRIIENENENYDYNNDDTNNNDTNSDTNNDNKNNNDNDNDNINDKDKDKNTKDKNLLFLKKNNNNITNTSNNNTIEDSFFIEKMFLEIQRNNNMNSNINGDMNGNVNGGFDKIEVREDELLNAVKKEMKEKIEEIKKVIIIKNCFFIFRNMQPILYNCIQCKTFGCSHKIDKIDLPCNRILIKDITTFLEMMDYPFTTNKHHRETKEFLKDELKITEYTNKYCLNIWLSSYFFTHVLPNKKFDMDKFIEKRFFQRYDLTSYLERMFGINIISE